MPSFVLLVELQNLLYELFSSELPKFDLRTFNYGGEYIEQSTSYEDF